MDAYYYECLKDGQYFEQYIYNVLEQLVVRTIAQLTAERHAEQHYT